jgi:AmmeMemoRadiSam system protein A
MSLPDNRRIITRAERKQLLGIAIASINSGLQGDSPPVIGSVTGPGHLAERLASFVTLKIGDALRGCIGSLEPHTTLADDVCQNAWSAAFRDPRFRPLQAAEFQALSVQVSVLSEPEKLEFSSEQDLIDNLRPGIDGLIIRDRSHRGTFLPAVWESLAEPGAFLEQLKLKAGLARDYWSETISVWRYTTESFSAEVASFAASNEGHLRDIPT